MIGPPSVSSSLFSWLQDLCSEPENLSASSSDQSVWIQMQCFRSATCRWLLRRLGCRHHMDRLYLVPSGGKDAALLLELPPTSSGNFAVAPASRDPGNKREIRIRPVFYIQHRALQKLRGWFCWFSVPPLQTS